MPPLSLVLPAVGLVVAIALAAYALEAGRARRALLQRVGAEDRAADLAAGLSRDTVRTRFTRWIMNRAPASWRNKSETGDDLLHAGFDGPAAPVIYALVRIAAVVLLPLAVIFLLPRDSLVMMALLVGSALAIGGLGPVFIVSHLAQARREKVRRAVPDSLDLLVVCVEAGISLDAALQRVAREMALLHPELATELMVLNRRVNAGMPREQALHGLWVRTGVDELRGLAANMIQSEKWGTSIATVLRIYAETLRRKRKQAAEKRAATAPLKMLFPLALFILPALFIVILGPAAITIADMFRQIHH